MELLHIVTIVHSLTCIIITSIITAMLRASAYIDRRQFYLILAMTSSITVLYFFSIVYVVYQSTLGSSTEHDDIITLLERVLDVISSLSNDTFSFLFALWMNFVLLFGVICLNVCSLYLAEVAKSIE
jgi:hypothetical protein